jgi:hypothetical protein
MSCDCHVWRYQGVAANLDPSLVEAWPEGTPTADANCKLYDRTSLAREITIADPCSCEIVRPEAARLQRYLTLSNHHKLTEQ